ncbi:MAG TPA: CAP domain-containing protein [Acidimicrobiales bacterium]|nr:CAP domain-containing protein [Acidimicrobiales bacterium]
MPRFARGLLVLTLVLSGLAMAEPAGATQADEQLFVSKLNDLRASRGLPRLSVDVRLTDVARQWSARMASAKEMSHNPNLAAQSPRDWQKLGENVGYGPSVSSLHDALVNSPPHLANMVDSKFNAVGLGVVISGSTIWVTQVFMQAANIVVASPSTPVAASGTDWYRLAGAGGETHSFGAATRLAGVRSSSPVVSIAATADGSGTWTAAADGSVFAQGTAGYFGSMSGRGLSHPVVGMAVTPSGKGYWLVARDGGIFAFGDAAFAGSTGAIRLNQPIVGMAADPDGAGYWFVAADGGVFAFDAPFAGSATGKLTGDDKVTGMAAHPSGQGYWLVTARGTVFAFGPAEAHGDAAGTARYIAGVTAHPGGKGYWMAARRALTRPPDARLSGAADSIRASQGSSCWQPGPSAALCADVFEFPADASILNVRRGEVVTVRFDAADPPIAARVLRYDAPATEAGSVRELTPSDAVTFTADYPVGLHRIALSTGWAQGSSSYLFRLNVR